VLAFLLSATTCWYCQHHLSAGISLLAAPPRGESIRDPLNSILWAHQFRKSLLDPFLPLASQFHAPRHRNAVAILLQPRRARRHRGSTPTALLRPIQHHWKFPLGTLKLLEQSLVAQPAGVPPSRSSPSPAACSTRVDPYATVGIQPSTFPGSLRSPLAIPPLFPHYCDPSITDLAGQIPPSLFDHGQGLHWRRQGSCRGFCANSRDCYVNLI
jgi:hypothetical protein